MRRLILTTCLLFFLKILLVGQTEFRRGQIIKVNHDTVSGLIDFGGDDRNSQVCTFKTETSPPRDYHPFEISGFRYKTGKFYISKYFRSKDNVKPFFVEYLVKGKKNLYLIVIKGHEHFLIDYQSDTVIEIPYSDESVYRNEKEYAREPTLYIGYLKSYFGDCPALFPTIEGIEKPEINNLVSLTRQYHHLTCGDSGCIVYYKKPREFSVAIEPKFGYVRYGLHTSYNPQYQFLLHFLIPRSNERMFMITGIMYGKSEGDNNDDYYEINQMYSITQVPIKFEYQFPYKIIKPKFDAGISFTFIYEDGGVRKNQGLSGSQEGSSYFVFNALGSAGVLICVSKNAGFDLSVDVEVISLTRSHSFYITHSFNGGVYFRF